MNVPGVDYNKTNLRWADRIGRENRVNGRVASVNFESHSNPDVVQLKINNLPSPFDRRKMIAEYMKNSKEEDGGLVNTVMSPRLKYYFPQASSQEVGWAVTNQLMYRSSRGFNPPKAVITGLYNKHCSSRPPRNLTLDRASHHVGYVTQLGNDSHPRKGELPEKEIIGIQPGTKPLDGKEVEWLESSIKYPGDHHMRPHEWAFVCSAMPETRVNVPEVIRPPTGSAVSIPTTFVRKVDEKLLDKVGRHKEFLNRVGSNKWYHPLCTNDVSSYGNAYVRCMHCGPHNKSQLLISR